MVIFSDNEQLGFNIQQSNKANKVFEVGKIFRLTLSPIDIQPLVLKRQCVEAKGL